MVVLEWLLTYAGNAISVQEKLANVLAGIFEKFVFVPPKNRHFSPIISTIIYRNSIYRRSIYRSRVNRSLDS